MVRLKAASVQRDIWRPFGVSGEQRRKRFIVKIVGVRCFANNFVVYRQHNAVTGVLDQRHVSGQNITGGRLCDVFHQLSAVGFEPLPFARVGVNALIGDVSFLDGRGRVAQCASGWQLYAQPCAIAADFQITAVQRFLRCGYCGADGALKLIPEIACCRVRSAPETFKRVTGDEKRMLNQGSENSSAMPMVTDSANGAADWIKEHWGFDPRSVGRTVRGWFGGDDPEQHGQSVKRPQPTKAGAELLGWMQPMLTNLEHLYRLPEGLLRSVAITESGGNQFAVSGAGAKGLFQFMDGTARDMGLRGNDVFDPEKAAQAAAKYLSQLLRANGGDLSKALASYNWGIGNVQKHGMALMPQETRNYIPRVLSNMPGRGTQVQQQNTYHIYGGGDPRQVGSEVERRQQSANAQVMRGNQTKVG